MTIALPVLQPAQPRFPSLVRPAPITPTKTTGLYVLKSAHHNKKLGAGKHIITKGPFRGMPLFSLTLPERTTCWTGCQNWDRCYGNNMWRALRYEPGLELQAGITKDVAHLAAKWPKGFVTRLHVLGDFYSPEYVEFWAGLLSDYEPLRLFGYTHWPQGSDIGAAVQQLVLDHPGRVSILRSDADGDVLDLLPRAMTVERDSPALPHTVLCPEQTGKTDSCLTCGLCMNGRSSVSFLDHS